MRGRHIVMTLLAVSCFLIGSHAMAADRVFGKGVSAPDTILVSKLLVTPDAYVGQTIRVQGLAVAVCQHRGCWVNISSDVEGETVRVKVTDGEIVFPPEILGDAIIAEGVWTSNKLDLETTRRVCAHQAEQDGKEFDPASVTGCMTLYQITGTGAVVKESAAENSEENNKDKSDGKS